MSAYYLLGINWVLGNDPAGSEKHKWCDRGEFSSQVAGGCLLGMKGTSFCSTSTTWGSYGTQAPGTDAVSLLTGPAMENQNQFLNS